MQSDAVTAVSDSLKATTQEQLGIEKQIQVVPNFIEPERFDMASRTAGARRWARPGERILVHVSNFRPVKRVTDVVDIFKRVHSETNARLLLVGDGPDRGKIEQYCRDCDICDDITFVGHWAQVEEILVGADLFLLPSETESFGLAALEALACEVPVIATRAGGIPEVVPDGVAGRLFEIGDVEGMAGAAIELLKDDARLVQMSRAGREWALENFTEDAIVERYKDVYERVLRD
jgi:N-acetyl-alpha-D-glucosaminyl L-malate synthase BshA